MTQPTGDGFDLYLEDLYDLTSDELRRLAWEALLISDGPNQIEGDANGPVHVSFISSGNHHWFMVSNPLEL
jgi:hypothetical protein